MAEEIKVGAATIVVKSSLDELKRGLSEGKSLSKKSASEMQNNLGNIKAKMDDRLLKLKLNDVQKLHTKLRKRLEEKIKLNYDVRSIEVTRKQLESVKNALRDIEAESKKPTKLQMFQNQNYFANAKGIATGLGIAIGINEVAQITAESVKLAAKVEGVERAFRDLNDPNLLSELNKVTNNTISDFELMRSILTGLDLGATNQQLKTFAEFARFESVRKGTDTLQTLQNILGGVLRGSTELLDNFGISLTELNKEIEILSEEKLNKASTSLTAVERRILSVDAATSIMNRRLEETGKIVETTGEKFAQNVKRIEDAKADLGKALINMSNESADILEAYLNTVGGIYKVLIDLVVDMDVDESQVQTEVNKAKQKTKNVIGRKWQILPDGSKIQVLPGGEDLFNALDSTFKQIEERVQELKAKKLTLTPKDIIDIRNIDNEIEQLEKFLNPKVKKELKSQTKIDFDTYSLTNEDFDWLDEQIEKENEAAQSRLENLQLYIDARKDLSEDEKYEILERMQREEELHRLRMSAISEFGFALEDLGSHSKTIVSYFNSALQAALRISEAIKLMNDETNGDSFSGALGILSGGLGFIASIFGLNKGGSIVNSGGGRVSYEPYKKFASGVSNFVVPPGFNRDNYIVGVQSGEKLSVTPANQKGENSSEINRILTNLYNRIGAQTEVIRNLQNSITIINNSPDVQTTVIKNKRAENRMVKRGYNLSDV